MNGILFRGAAVAATVIAAFAPASGAAPAPLHARILTSPPQAVADTRKHLDLYLDMIDSEIYNPASGREEKVSLRGYRSDRVIAEQVAQGFIDDSPNPFVAPTLVVRPGETFSVTLHNLLRGTPTDPDACHNLATAPEACFNFTNLHTHGLEVSPVQDDVINVVKPGETKTYTYTLAADHPAGTFWYHPHNHGSTAVQVGGGAAGALIVLGSRNPTARAPGEIDTLLATLGPKERVMVLQQLQYACYEADGKTIKTYTDGTRKGTWRCDPGDVGVIKGYGQLGFNGSASTENWTVSGRFTSINGEIIPTFVDAKVGQIERWRLIDSGLANTIGIVVRKLAQNYPPYDHLNIVDNATWVNKYCTGPIVHQFSIATDGLTRPAIDERATFVPPSGDRTKEVPAETILQPGYRDDLLIAFPDEGDYCVIDQAAEGAAALRQDEERPQLLGIVKVDAGATRAIDNQSLFMQGQLVQAAAKAGYDSAVEKKVIADLHDGLRLTAFVQHPDLTRLPPSKFGRQELAFNIITRNSKTKFEIGTSIADPSTDKSFESGHVDRILKPGGQDQWFLSSRNAAHPFHIHINPFQIVAIYNANGLDVSETGEADDQEYAHKKGVWKDTIFVKPHYTVVMRTHYAPRYTGRFVLHCHILDHEDQGMMELIQIGNNPAPAETPETKAFMSAMMPAMDAMPMK